jgi:hypothetical protein
LLTPSSVAGGGETAGPGEFVDLVALHYHRVLIVGRGSPSQTCLRRPPPPVDENQGCGQVSRSGVGAAAGSEVSELGLWC